MLAQRSTDEQPHGEDTLGRRFDEIALHGDETSRARGWSLAVSGLCVFTLSALPLLPGEILERTIACTSLIVLGLVSVWVFRRTRSEETYSRKVFRIFGWTAATCSLGITYFMGVFSPVSLCVTLGIGFFGSGLDRQHAVAIPVYASTGYVIISLLVTNGAIPDVGVVRAADITWWAQHYFIITVPAIYSVCLWLARLSRESMTLSLRRTYRAQLLAEQREALLTEAKQHLEEALKAGKGLEGPCTGEMAGNYVLQEVIGRGAMGEVYAAMKSSTEERAAVKLLRHDQMSDTHVMTRFFREANILTNLHSPHIVRIYDVGRMDNRIPYMVMELLTGQSLATLLRHEDRLSPAEVADMLDEVAMGLDDAHQAEVVHRDLKPQNLFLNRDAEGQSQSWKILDFGVARRQNAHETLTQAHIVGTPAYMAPEQAQGLRVGPTADIYSLGAVVYRALTGNPLSHGSDIWQILYDIVNSSPIRPSHLNPTLTREIEATLAIALAKNPEHRFRNGSQFAEAFRAAVDGELSQEAMDHANALLSATPWKAGLEPEREEKPDAQALLVRRSNQTTASPQTISAARVLPVDLEPTDQASGR